MADDTTQQGNALIAADEVTDVNGNLVAAVKVQRVKPGYGADGFFRDVSTTSPLPGPSGNVEFFLWLRRGEATIGEAEIDEEVRRTAALGVPGEKVDT